MEKIIGLDRKLEKTRLQFYLTPPTDVISLDEIEVLAVERLKALRCIESIAQDFVKGTKEYKERMLNELSKSNFSKSFIRCSDDNIQTDIKNDILSHYILKLAYCKTEDLSNWFLNQELDLFTFRLQSYMNNTSFISNFMCDNNIQAEETSKQERKFFNSNEVVFKVRLLDVLDLVRQRKIFLYKGNGLLLQNDISSLIISQFRSNISLSLSFLRLSLPQLDEDSRLIPFLSTLNNRHLGKDYSKVEINEKIMSSQIDSLSKKSFPPCMQQIHSVLLRDHHLKHGARMQYGLFLKGIGLSLEESLKYFKTNFQEKIDSETFNKKYSYSIRHNYGQEGKRASYRPYNCVKIITSNLPQDGDCHGCPFQFSNLALILQNLRSTTKATKEQLDYIENKAKLNQYQISCKTYFKLTHDLPQDYPITINHPNEYFDQSRKIFSDKTLSLF